MSWRWSATYMTTSRSISFLSRTKSSTGSYWRRCNWRHRHRMRRTLSFLKEQSRHFYMMMTIRNFSLRVILRIMNSSFPKRIHFLAERFARKSTATSTTSFARNITLTGTLKCSSRNSKLRRCPILKEAWMIQRLWLREVPRVCTLYNEI